MVALVVLNVPLARAADWPTYGGDAQRSGWQKREKDLNTGNVHELTLLWKRQLDNQSKGWNSLTSPVLLGPIITHRGIKELVFVASSSDNVYAVDADLGRLFWKRHIDSPAAPDRKSSAPCGSGLTATPVIGPPQAAPVNQDDTEPSTPVRPLYVLSSDGRLHTIRPSDGNDMSAPVRFIPPSANAANLNLVAGSIHTMTSNSCGGVPDGIWSMPVNSRDAKAAFSPSGGNAPVGRAVTPIPFTWKGRELAVGPGTQGRVVLLDATHRAPISSNKDVGGLATSEDASGTRWIYAALQDSIAAFQIAGNATDPKLVRVWTTKSLLSSAPPVVANGIVFALAGSVSTHATLYALDATTGRKLFSSGDSVKSFTSSSGLALANGHVCFTTADNTLYCFGIPIEI